MLPAPPRQRDLLRQLAGALRACGVARFDGGAAVPPEDELAALAGPLFGDDPIPVLLAALDAARPDPSTAWRREAALPDALARFVGAALPAAPRPLDRADLLFLLAARVVAAPHLEARFEVLPAAERAAVLAGIEALRAPAGALLALLGLAPYAPSRRRRITTPDGATHYLDFDALLGVEPRPLPRRGLLGKVPGLARVAERCTAPRCRTPLPTWLPRCHGCGRPVVGAAEALPSTAALR